MNPVVDMDLERNIQKFVFGHDSSGTAYVISTPQSYHRDIYEEFKQKSNTSLEDISGGFIEKVSGDSYKIFGMSESFGPAPLEEVRAVLSRNGFHTTIDSAFDRYMKSEQDSFQTYLEKFDSDFLRQAIIAVKESAILGGFDRIREPQLVGDSAALVTYSMENGGTFGFDTLYAVTLDEGNKLLISPIVRQRWNLFNVDAELHGDKLEVSYAGDHARQSLEVNMRHPQLHAMHDTLSTVDLILLQMYQRQTEEVRKQGGPDVINARLHQRQQDYAGMNKKGDTSISYNSILNSRGHPTKQFEIMYM